MEGLERITKSIKKEAGGEKEKILKEAEEEAEEVKSEAREEAKIQSEEIIREAEEEANRVEEKILSSAHMKSRQKKLKTQDDIIEKIFSNAMEKLRNHRKNLEEYTKTMRNLIKRGGIVIGGGDLEVLTLEEDDLLSEEDVEKLSNDISEETGRDTSLKILNELDDASGGVIVQKSDGSARCDNTFDARLGRSRNSLRTEIAKMLFKLG